MKDDTTEGNHTAPKLDFRPTRFSDALASALRKDGLVDHFRNLNWKRNFLSKTRYMWGRQCSKRLWQTVYDPEPAEEPLPSTVKGMGIEVGIKARLLWPGGILVDTKYDQAEAVRRTLTLRVSDQTRRFCPHRDSFRRFGAIAQSSNCRI